MPDLTYDRNRGQFEVAETGTVISKTEVDRQRDLVIQRLKNELNVLANRYANDQIDLERFQTEVAIRIKRHHLQVAGLASGGIDRLNRTHFVDIRDRLDTEFTTFLFAFGNWLESIASQKKDFTRNIVNRAIRYAASVARSFFSSQKITRSQDGANEAKRRLDPRAQHCRQCPNYDTGGRWIPIDRVVPVGEQCDCRGNCRCTVEYRFSLTRAVLGRR